MVKPKQPWYSYAKGKKGNRVVCWSEILQDREKVFSLDNTSTKSPSLGETLKNIEKTIKKDVIKKTTSPVITKSNSKIGDDVKPLIEKEATKVKKEAEKVQTKTQKTLQKLQSQANETVKVLASQVRDTAVNTATAATNAATKAAQDVFNVISRSITPTQSGGKSKKHKKSKKRKKYKKHKKSKKHRKRSKSKRTRRN